MVALDQFQHGERALVFGHFAADQIVQHALAQRTLGHAHEIEFERVEDRRHDRDTAGEDRPAGDDRVAVRHDLDAVGGHRHGERARDAGVVVNLERQHPPVVGGDVVLQRDPQLPQVAGTGHPPG